MISILNYGMGNLGSTVNMLKRIGFKSEIISTPESLLQAQKIILPGVGAFDSAMSALNSIPGLRQALTEKVIVEKVPILGICLGMQLLTSFSEEGTLPGLDFIPGKTLRFPKMPSLKVPHMGWNTIKVINKSKISANVKHDHRFYFVHSYYVSVESSEHSLMTTEHGLCFDSAIANDNIFGVQFHPEKSHRYGKNILKNFAQL